MTKCIYLHDPRVAKLAPKNVQIMTKQKFQTGMENVKKKNMRSNKVNVFIFLLGNMPYLIQPW